MPTQWRIWSLLSCWKEIESNLPRESLSFEFMRWGNTPSALSHSFIFLNQNTYFLCTLHYLLEWRILSLINAFSSLIVHYFVIVLLHDLPGKSSVTELPCIVYFPYLNHCFSQWVYWSIDFVFVDVESIFSAENVHNGEQILACSTNYKARLADTAS